METAMSDPVTPPYVGAPLLDAVEKYVMTAVYILFAYRMISAYGETGSPVTLIYLADQLTVLVFILLRRSTKDLSLRLDDWIVGVAGTFFALLISAPSGSPLVPPFVITGLLMGGFAIHVSAKLALRRSFGVVAANRGVKATGIYRLVRHPMYLGYAVSQFGLLLAGPSTYNIAIIGLCWLLFVKRIEAEERLLSQDKSYRDFAAHTRYRLLPGIY